MLASLPDILTTLPDGKAKRCYLMRDVELLEGHLCEESIWEEQPLGDKRFLELARVVLSQAGMSKEDAQKDDV